MSETPETEKSDLRVFANSSLLIVQSRLHNPSYAGPGRWTIVNAKTKRGFLAAGSDIVPESLKIIEQACFGSLVSDLAELVDVPVPRIERLRAAEILTETATLACNFTSLYHALTFDYPFQDYSTAEWREKDHATMEAYASLWPPPEVHTAYAGKRLPLPSASVMFDEFADGSNGSHQSRIATVLQFAFRPTGKIESSFMTCLKRTSPSGGARHPTDGFLIVGEDTDGLVRGVYAYDSASNQLVLQENIQPPSSKGIGIAIRSSVERAMWRYRDIRAYRPVLLDAGHIIEAIIQASTALGFSPSLHLPQPRTADLPWLKQPEFVHIALNGEYDLAQSTDEPASDGPDSAEYATNPFLVVLASPKGLVARVAWPSLREVPVSSEDFAILSHCTPSQRGDRPTDIESIQAATGGSLDTIHNFARNGILLSPDDASVAYRGARLWSKYGWYLSLLKALEFGASCRGQNVKTYLPRAEKQVLSANNVAAITKRKTCRSFKDKPIDQATLEALLGVIGTTSVVENRVAAYSVDGLSHGLYTRSGDGGLQSLGRGPSRSDVASATIGQQPSSAGAVTIWLYVDIDELRDSAEYEVLAFEVGRTAHRICLAATELGLGVFLTPALSEADTCKLLSIDAPPEQLIPYLISIGYPR